MYKRQINKGIDADKLFGSLPVFSGIGASRYNDSPRYVYIHELDDPKLTRIHITHETVHDIENALNLEKSGKKFFDHKTSAGIYDINPPGKNWSTLNAEQIGLNPEKLEELRIKYRNGEDKSLDHALFYITKGRNANLEEPIGNASVVISTMQNNNIPLTVDNFINVAMNPENVKNLMSHDLYKIYTTPGLVDDKVAFTEYLLKYAPLIAPITIGATELISDEDEIDDNID